MSLNTPFGEILTPTRRLGQTFETAVTTSMRKRHRFSMLPP